MLRKIIALTMVLSFPALAQFTPPPPRSVTVTGEVQAFPPDGGLRVTLGSDIVPVSGTVSANILGTVPITGNVQAFPPDGGSLVTFGQAVFPITCAQPDGGTCILDVQGRGGGNLFVAQQGPVEVTGLAGGQVDAKIPSGVAITNSPTISLSSSSLAAITAASAERVCTYGTPLVVAALTTTPSAQPPTPQTGRTEITLINLQTDSRELWCRVNGTPSSTNAIVTKAGVTLKLNVTDAQTVNCMCSASTCRINLQEALCTHP